MREQMGSILDQRIDYASDINDLKTSMEQTRRALNPKLLGQHVADNIDHFMGPVAHKLIRTIEANADIVKHNMNAAKQTINAAKDVEDKASKLQWETQALASITTRLEERDQTSKYDWATLGCAMLIAAGLASGAAYFIAKDKLAKASFASSVHLIRNDQDGKWCNLANGKVVQNDKGVEFCVKNMEEAGEKNQWTKSLELRKRDKANLVWQSSLRNIILQKFLILFV